MQVLGVLGGLGPASSALFHRRIVEACQDLHFNPSSFPRVIYDDAPAVDVTGWSRDPGVRNAGIAALAKSSQDLSAAGAGALALPCVTAHIWIEDIRAACALPVLSLVDSAVRAVRGPGPVGLLATTPTAALLPKYRHAMISWYCSVSIDTSPSYP